MFYQVLVCLAFVFTLYFYIVFFQNNDFCRHLVNFTGTNGIVSAYGLEADDT